MKRPVSISLLKDYPTLPYTPPHAQESTPLMPMMMTVMMMTLIMMTVMMMTVMMMTLMMMMMILKWLGMPDICHFLYSNAFLVFKHNTKSAQICNKKLHS